MILDGDLVDGATIHTHTLFTTFFALRVRGPKMKSFNHLVIK